MMSNNYILTRHADLRMKERNISINDLDIAIKYPDILYKGKRGEINAIKEVEKQNEYHI
jgi:hypothetical protein